MGRIDDPAAYLDVTVPRECQGQGVLVDHDPDFVPGLFPAGLDVDDDGVTVVGHDEVGLAG